jgi:hypothetical protein
MKKLQTEYGYVYEAGEVDSLLKKLEDAALGNEESAAMGRARLSSIKEIIDGIENRCLAADGPVTNTRHEMTDEELRRIYRLAGGTTAK